MTTVESRTTLVDALRTLPDEFISCRDTGLGHTWNVQVRFRRPSSDITTDPAVRLVRTTQCGRCGTVKHELYEQGDLCIVKLRNRYVYPDGYVLKGVQHDGRPSVAVLQEQYRRAGL